MSKRQYLVRRQKTPFILMVLGILCILLLSQYTGMIRILRGSNSSDDVLDSGRASVLQKITENRPNITRMPHRAVKEIRKGMENVIVTEYDHEVRDRLQTLIARNAEAKDPEVVSLVQDLMDPPSASGVVKLSRPLLATPQAKAVIEYLHNRRDGFFIECGALDGERASNTIYLEQKLGWTGILIEMDPFFYTQLRGKNRLSYSINACLSPTDRPSQIAYKGSSLGEGKLSLSGGVERAVLPMVPCFPLESILLALNRTHVDYFSLDVEGLEAEVLGTIPFDRIDFDILSVEYVHGKGGKQAYRELMEQKGYTVKKEISFSDSKLYVGANDFIFVKV